MEDARRASLLDKEARQIRALELAVGASSSRFVYFERRTAKGANIVLSTTDGGLTTEGASFGKPDPPTY